MCVDGLGDGGLEFHSFEDGWGVEEGVWGREIAMDGLHLSKKVVGFVESGVEDTVGGFGEGDDLSSGSSNGANEGRWGKRSSIAKRKTTLI